MRSIVLQITILISKIELDQEVFMMIEKDFLNKEEN